MKKLISLILFLVFVSTPFVYAQYVKLLDFSGGPTGSYPEGSLIYDNTFLYGMTQYGGASGLGAIFKIKPDGTEFSKLFDFATSANGRNPLGSLIFDSTFLYGMTELGGVNDSGVIFKIKPDGSSYTKLFDFSGASTGCRPQGSLIFDGTYLYGMTSNGGANHYGAIFKIKPDGTGFSKIFDFNCYTSGCVPCGSLVYDDTFLYGMTLYGGIHNDGVIFKIETDGSGYNKLLDFSTTTGSSPFGSLMRYGNSLYGMTSKGGIYDNGVIFSLNFDGSNYSRLYEFTFIEYGIEPESSLVTDGTYLYGETFFGGLYTYGVVFKVKLDGSNYYKMLDFSNFENGSDPTDALKIIDNTLYGVTGFGGSYYNGTIFKIGTTTGIDENNSVSYFNLYPNPTINKIAIESSETISTIEIYNLLGEKLLASSATALTKSDGIYEIALNDFPQGMYFVKIYKNDNTYSEKKFVKE